MCTHLFFFSGLKYADNCGNCCVYWVNWSPWCKATLCSHKLKAARCNETITSGNCVHGKLAYQHWLQTIKRFAKQNRLTGFSERQQAHNWHWMQHPLQKEKISHIACFKREIFSWFHRNFRWFKQSLILSQEASLGLMGFCTNKMCVCVCTRVFECIWACVCNRPHLGGITAQCQVHSLENKPAKERSKVLTLSECWNYKTHTVCAAQKLHCCI